MKSIRFQYSRVWRLGNSLVLILCRNLFRMKKYGNIKIAGTDLEDFAS